MITKKGFISNPYSRTRGDSISAARVVKDINDSAMKGCGCWYEIYHYRALDQLMALMDLLSDTDQQTLKDAAAKLGFNIDEKALDESRRASDEIYEELRRDQE